MALKDISSIQIGFVTLGCAKNEVDSQKMADELRSFGYSITDDMDRCNVLIVNTCSFIQNATEESIGAILDAIDYVEAAKRQIPIIVCGCLVSRYAGELEQELEEVARFVSCNDERNILSIVNEVVECQGRQKDSDGLKAGLTQSMDAPIPPKTEDPVFQEDMDCFDLELDGPSENPFSAYVKISDGCDRFCSYCTIPYIRGRYRSFAYDAIERDVEKHVASGKKEIILIAQDTGRWGADLDSGIDGPSNLAQLVKRLASDHEDVWFRVMYIQPEGITDDLLDVIAQKENVCPYLDIPLQHVCSHIVDSMNRKGSFEQYRALLERIVEKIPDVSLRTTFIVGFPGEGDDDFEKLKEFVELGYFSHIGIFPYSKEEGTRAFGLSDQISDTVKLDRFQELRDLADVVCASKVAQNIGNEVQVLIESAEEDGQLIGRAMGQAPEVDGITFVDSGCIGTISKAKVIDTLYYDMEAETISQEIA